jgi:Cohesin domain
MLPIIVAISVPFFAKANLGITTITTQDGNNVAVDFLVYNFNNIASIQYTIQWDPTIMQFESIEDFQLPGLSSYNNFGINNPNNLQNGHLPHSWIDPATLGITLPDCSVIYRVNFTSLNGQASPIIIGEIPTIIEVVNGDGVEIGIEQNLSCGQTGQIRGIIFHDENGNCLKDEVESKVEGCSVRLQQDGLIYYIPTNENGEYFFNGVAGDHDLSVVLPDNITLLPCLGLQTVYLNENEQVEQNFGLSPESVSSAKELEQAGVFAKISPNPTSAGLPIFIETNSETTQSLTLQAYGTNGKLLRQWNQSVAAGKKGFSANPDLKPGLYLLKITTADGVVYSAKLVVQ